MRFFALLAVLPLWVACAPSATPAAETTTGISLGNGTRNSIEIEGVTREGQRFTFKSVTIENDGWLVIHPFRDGRPNGDIYVGHTFVPAGSSEQVAVEVTTEVNAGDPFLVMLHQDVDEDQVFDFVFVEDNVVEDRAVFEGTTMIAHTFTAP